MSSPISLFPGLSRLTGPELFVVAWNGFDWSVSFGNLLASLPIPPAASPGGMSTDIQWNAGGTFAGGGPKWAGVSQSITDHGETTSIQLNDGFGDLVVQCAPGAQISLQYPGGFFASIGTSGLVCANGPWSVTLPDGSSIGWGEGAGTTLGSVIGYMEVMGAWGTGYVPVYDSIT